MTLREAKEIIKTCGIYSGISYLSEHHSQEDADAIREIIYRFLDNIPEDVYYRAFRKSVK